MTVPTISPQALQALQQEGKRIELIDVRTPPEFDEVHTDGARLVPLGTLDATSLAAEFTKRSGDSLYVICRTGSRSAQACQALRAEGLETAISVEGGTLAWEQAGLPVIRGRRMMSLERQVRIAAGLLVVTGAALAWFVHRGFLALPAFVGAGLAFSRLTDTCGLGRLLAHMPWNRGALDR